MMDGDAPAVTRLGIPAYHYGYEALHGMINGCPFPDRCVSWSRLGPELGVCNIVIVSHSRACVVTICLSRLPVL